MTLALVALACLCLRLWWFIPLLAPGLYLSHSRGAWLALALGFVGWLRPDGRVLVLVILWAILALTYSTNTGDLERILIWKSTLANLTWFGNGSGAFASLWIIHNGILTHPDSVHSDALQLLFEFGLGALPFLALGLWCLCRTEHPLWPVLSAFTFLSFFSFPLFTPLCALTFGLCAGRACASGAWLWPRLPNRGRLQFLFHVAQRPFWRSLRSQALPLQSGT